MLRYLYMDNFKSLVDFELPPKGQELGKFVCLIGLNGAGKSSVLQALDFLAHLMTGQTAEWLNAREWAAGELTSRLTTRRNITFEVKVELPNVGAIVWEGAFNPYLNRCTSEHVWALHRAKPGRPRLKVEDGRLVVEPFISGEIPFDYHGSVMSQLKLTTLMPELIELKKFIESWKSLELLAPQLMRRRSRETSDIGRGGEKLAGFIHALEEPQRKDLTAILRSLYPNLREIRTISERGGWTDIVFEEQALSLESPQMHFKANHANDGMLRLLAVLAQTQTSHQVLLFDEIENGINPEIIGKLVKCLIDAPQQVFITTHSPLVLNYLPDEIAQDAVILLYRDPKGATKATRFFDLPVPKEKLSVLGPGEVFVDTYLEDVVRDVTNYKASQ